MESLQNSTGSSRRLFGLSLWKIEPVNTHQMSSYMFAGIINSKKTFIWVELLANLVKWRYLTIFNMQNNGSSIWWCETFILEEMMRLQDTSTNLQTSLTTGLEKYANALIIQGKRKKNPPICFKNSLTQISVHRGEQGRLCLLTWC